jgi:hypothetical protein
MNNVIDFSKYKSARSFDGAELHDLERRVRVAAFMKLADLATSADFSQEVQDAAYRVLEGLPISPMEILSKDEVMAIIEGSEAEDQPT